MSDVEKGLEGPRATAENSVMHMLPDPDAHLSEDERKAVVSHKSLHSSRNNILTRQDRELLLRLDFILIPWVGIVYQLIVCSKIRRLFECYLLTFASSVCCT